MVGCVPPVPVPGVSLPPGKPCCGPRFCCQKFYFCLERAPKIKFKCVCSCKGVCDPCLLENYGYYPVCWRPMGPLNYNHFPKSVCTSLRDIL